jgi:hypothetical protein
MKSNYIPFRVLTNEEMSTIKGAGPNPVYLGPPVQNGADIKGSEENFFSTLAAFFSFDFSAIFGNRD